MKKKTTKVTIELPAVVSFGGYHAFRVSVGDYHAFRELKNTLKQIGMKKVKVFELGHDGAAYQGMVYIGPRKDALGKR